MSACPTWCDNQGGPGGTCDGEHSSYHSRDYISATAGHRPEVIDDRGAIMPTVGVGIDDRYPLAAPAVTLHVVPAAESVEFKVHEAAEFIEYLISRYVDLVSELPPFRIYNDEELTEQCTRLLNLINARRPKGKNA